METIVHLRSTAADSFEQAQRALALAWTYQNDPSNPTIPQLLALTHVLDVACSLLKFNPQQTVAKLKAMQIMMDRKLNDSAWNISLDSVSVPMNATKCQNQLVSCDTRRILDVGADGRDQLMISWKNQRDCFGLTFLLSGIVLLHRNDPKAANYLEEGLRTLSGMYTISRQTTTKRRLTCHRRC